MPRHLHAADFLFIGVLGKILQTGPPFKEHGFTYQFEPWSELQVRVLEHRFQLVGRDILGVLDLIGIGRHVDRSLGEENVID